jgi:hypothetical protein
MSGTLMTEIKQLNFCRFFSVLDYIGMNISGANDLTCYIQVSPKRRRVHNSGIYRKILIICTPNLMVVNRLQNGLINSSIAPWTSKVNCQNIFFQMGLHIFF